jgi:hypothetical protein
MQYVSANVSSLVFLEAYFKYWQYKSVETGQNVVGGYYKKAGNFTFATFNNAGHVI